MSHVNSVGSPSGEAATHLNRHFKRAAALAAATVVIGGANNSRGAIIYSGLVNDTTSTATTGINYIYFNLQTGAVSSTAGSGYQFALQYSPTSTGGTLDITEPNGLGGHTVVPASIFSQAYSSKLASGVTVGPSSTFSGSTAFNNGSILSYYSYGYWAGPVTSQFLGLSFTGTDGLTHYGWARLNVAATTNVETLVDFAYESTPATAIVTGAVPEPTSLGLLALGAVGLVKRPRRQELN
jgi:hypothetical protein